MALNWTAKAPDDVYRYTWTPALAEGDSVSSYSVDVDGATIDADSLEDNAVVLFVSGGTAGSTATFTLEAVSADGETLTETIYLPIVASAATGPTARDVCNFALRKVVGLGEEPDADEERDALENLNDMLRMWKGRGLDMGVAFPLVAGSEMKVRDEFLSAIKLNLRVVCHNFYGVDLTAVDVQMADAAYRAASALLISFDNVAMPANLANPVHTVADLF